MLIGSCEPDNDRYITLNLIECLNKTDKRGARKLEHSYFREARLKNINRQHEPEYREALKLRQVCCHPKLFLPDYEGTSGKLELLVQTVHSAIDSGRRMLIFSQFVGMLQIIRKRLSREGVSCLYLDGSTHPEERQRLCDRFNGGDGKVFLFDVEDVLKIRTGERGYDALQDEPDASA